MKDTRRSRSTHHTRTATWIVVVAFVMSLGAWSPAAFATSPQVIDLWTGEMPGPRSLVRGEEGDMSKAGEKLVASRPVIRLGNVSNPQMHVYLPSADKASGGAVLVCPGGGFNILAWDLEGTEVAEWLNDIGMAAIVVKYRVPTAAHGNDLLESIGLPKKAVGPVADVQRAISITRQNADKWNIDPKRIGVMGFSAGGATAGYTAIMDGKRAYEATDEIDRNPCDVAFAMPIYPGGFVDTSTGELNDYLRVTEDTPPMFFVMAQDDRVGCENCLVLYSALTKHKVPAEMHLFARGGHGYGIRPTMTPVTHWSNRATKWLRDMGYAISASAIAKTGTPSQGNPADHLPKNLQQVAKFGERVEFSPDGTPLMFVSKQFGDVMEYHIGTGKLRCLTQHFNHYGFNRALYFSNGDYLLTGPDETFDMADPSARRHARDIAKMYVMSKSLDSPPVHMGVVATEGPAVSRRQLKVAWTHHLGTDDNSVDFEAAQNGISMGDIVYEDGVPRLKNVELLLTIDDFPKETRPKMIETQNFVGPDDKALTVTAYMINNGHNTDGYLFDLKTRKLRNFTNTPDHSEEVEGIFPDGLSTLVERNRSVNNPWPLVDAWRVWFDGSREPERLTRFLDFPGYKASNYVVSDDGHYMAFQLGKSGEEAGVGHGIFLMELAPQ